MIFMKQCLYALFLVLCLFVVGNAYDAFQEGYLNYERNTDRPNLPFAVDTNRYTDGFTSTSSSSELTSPHFPMYIGAIANTSDRYLKFASYMEDAALQGLAGYVNMQSYVVCMLYV